MEQLGTGLVVFIPLKFATEVIDGKIEDLFHGQIQAHGVVGVNFNEKIAHKVGHIFARFLVPEGCFSFLDNLLILEVRG